MDRTAVVAALRELARLLEATGAPTFRVRAVERAAETVDQLPEGDLERRVELGELEVLPHVGPGLARRIDALAREGSLAELDELRGRVPSGFRELSRVEGLGPKRVMALHEALGIQTLDDLLDAIDAGRVRTVRGFSAAAEERLRAAAQEAKQRVDRHLWLAAVREAERWSVVLERVGLPDVRVAGEARRAREQVDAAVLVVTSPEPGTDALRVSALPGLLAARREGPRVRGRSVDGLPVELYVAAPEALGATLVHATGPEDHVALLARAAEGLGLSLRPDGLFEGEVRLPTPDEPALYARLGLPWIPAEWRGEADEAPPDDLLSVGDLVGLVHCHTTWSDGRHTVEQMAKACDALGLAYLTVTDHSPSAGYAGGVDVDRLKRQWEEIDRVQEQVRVVLLKGTESDILADGSLDYPDAVLEQLDVVIASIHQRHRMDAEAMTERLERAMRHPLYKIWGHGLGRLIGRRDPIACDQDRVLDAIAASRAAVEINADPHRLDLPPDWIRAARARGIPLVVSADAHSVGGLSVLPFGVGLARRAGVRRGEVLNARPVEAFRAAVRPAG